MDSQDIFVTINLLMDLIGEQCTEGYDVYKISELLFSLILLNLLGLGQRNWCHKISCDPRVLQSLVRSVSFDW